MKRFWRALNGVAMLAIGALVFFATVPLWRRSTAPAVETWNGRSSLPFAIGAATEVRAGAAKVKLPAKQGSPLAGYATVLPRRWDGTGDDLFARALVIDKGGVRQIVVSLELLLISPDLESEIFRRAGLSDTACALVAATHTHSGPGGTWDNALAGWMGNGGFDRGQRDAIAQAAAEAVAQAVASLRPATLRVGHADAERGPAVPRSGGAIDPRLTVIRAESSDGVLATVAIYGMHPTILGRASRRLSGDWPGAAARQIESAAGGVALVLQGAVGNATWKRDGDEGVAAVERNGKLIADLALSVRPLSLANEVSCSVRLVPLPPLATNKAVPLLLRRLATNVLSLADPKMIPQVQMAIGRVRLQGIAGEPVGPLGVRARPATLVGLADGYAGYVESEEGGEPLSYFGPDLARALGL